MRPASATSCAPRWNPAPRCSRSRAASCAPGPSAPSVTSMPPGPSWLACASRRGDAPGAARQVRSARPRHPPSPGSPGLGGSCFLVGYFRPHGARLAGETDGPGPGGCGGVNLAASAVIHVRRRRGRPSDRACRAQRGFPGRESPACSSSRSCIVTAQVERDTDPPCREDLPPRVRQRGGPPGPVRHSCSARWRACCTIFSVRAVRWLPYSTARGPVNRRGIAAGPAG